MVIDSIENRARYALLDKKIHLALDFIAHNRDFDPHQSGDAVSVADGVSAFYVEKHTQAEPDMEVHYLNFDIHYIISGAERCGTSDFPQEVVYQTDKDIALFKETDDSSFLVKENMFYIVWPGEAHKPLCNPEDSSVPVRKIICKVRM